MTNIKTIWDFLALHGFEAKERPSKKTVQLALDHTKLNKAQTKRMPDPYMIMEKLDGIYAMVVAVNIAGSYIVKCFGRSGKALSGVECVADEYKKALEQKGFTKSIIIITELMSSFGPEGLAKFSGYTNPNRKNTASNIPEWVTDRPHDFLTVPEFIAGMSEYHAEYRYDLLTHVLRQIGMEDKKVSYYHGNYEELVRFARYVIKDGGEGALGILAA